MVNKGTPLDYENAGVYTNSLLDAYTEYKEIWKNIQACRLIRDQNQTLTSLPQFRMHLTNEITPVK